VRQGAEQALELSVCSFLLGALSAGSLGGLPVGCCRARHNLHARLPSSLTQASVTVLFWPACRAILHALPWPCKHRLCVWVRATVLLLLHNMMR
jgi:hypothetical protein